MSKLEKSVLGALVGLACWAGVEVSTMVVGDHYRLVSLEYRVKALDLKPGSGMYHDYTEISDKYSKAGMRYTDFARKYGLFSNLSKLVN